VRARKVVAGTVVNNVCWMTTLESACERQGDTVNLRHVEKTYVQNYEKNFEEVFKISGEADGAPKRFSVITFDLASRKLVRVAARARFVPELEGQFFEVYT